MATFDIKRIMLDYSVGEKELASVLFPDNKFPERALERALGGQSKITVDQVSALSAYLGVPVYALFTDGGWYNVPDRHYSVLRKGDITAIIRSDTITIRDKFTGVEQYIARPDCLTAKSVIDLLDKELAKDLL